MCRSCLNTAAIVPAMIPKYRMKGVTNIAAVMRIAKIVATFARRFMASLTPELSRADERPRRWDDHSASAEAAKRTRLERIVSWETSR